ncbi:putative Dehydratase IlvD1 [Seiridium unicorne]|uniref:Dehydratase IlvD1 n=1 Tax=Seiridium unicorne TaxID=138068 RepID=A0ABR2UQK0_9PEZI
MRVPRGLSCIQPFGDPLYPASSLVVLRGNIAPRGAVIKASASEYRRLLKHSGQPIVFKNSEDMARRLDDPQLPVTADSVLVLQTIGPKGNPGMPEAGLIPIPKKLAAQGITEMLRLSDGRMSGTAGGTVVLHISPESADPSSLLGIVQDGDLIIFDTESRLITLHLSDDEIMAQQWKRQASTESSPLVEAGVDVRKERGYRGIYKRSVLQADQGAEFDFLTAEGLIDN